jgi:hypothetical protein
MIADTDHLLGSWFRIDIFGGLNGADVEFVDTSANDGEYGDCCGAFIDTYGVCCSRLICWRNNKYFCSNVLNLGHAFS